MEKLSRHCTFAHIFLIGTLLLPAAMWGQTKTEFSLPELLLRQDMKATSRSQIESKAVPLDNLIDPVAYIVGPGDVISLNIWSSAPADYRLTVTPEGFLLVPSVGAVDLRGLSLDALKKKVGQLVARKYMNAEVSLTLLSPREVAVQITGQVLNEGRLVVNATERVDRLIDAANALPSTQITTWYYDAEVPRLRWSASQRHIVVEHRDGTRQRVDLVKYETSGNSSYNPYLREGDVVFVPLRRDPENSIGVYGGVPNPRGVEYAVGDSLTDLVKFGYGLKIGADTSHGILTRLSPEGTSMDTMLVDLKKILAGQLANIALRPGDRLFVPEKPESRLGYRVSIEGEVTQPGRYPIARNGTKLSDAVRLAGGFTKDAYLPGAYILRSRLSPLSIPEEVQQEQLLSQRTSLGVQDSGYYRIETALRMAGEVVNVDFERLFVRGDSTQDIYLHNYDRIIVPQKTGTVYVFGQVISPGHITWVEGEGVRYYIGKALGFTNNARSGDTKIIKSSTHAWLDPGETTIDDGDYIWVPKDPSYPFSYYLTSWAQVASIVGAVATVALLVTQLKK